MKRTTKTKVSAAPKLHYAVYKKHSLCGIPKARAAADLSRINCRKCRMILSRLSLCLQKINQPIPASPAAGIFLQIGQKIRILREGKSLTRAQLARACGLSPTHLQRIEEGDHNMTFKTFVQIVGSLGVTLEEALTGIQ